jgi:hypothetical protein
MKSSEKVSVNYIETSEQPAEQRPRNGDAMEKVGTLSQRNASGAPCEKTTVATEMRGTTSAMTKPARVPIAWGEDGLAGISDDKQQLCFAIAQWNGRDSILKERLFGLTNSEGNHGEDVKEYYLYYISTARRRIPT